VGVLAKLASDNGNLATDFDLLAEPSVACDSRDVSGNLPLIFNENAAPDGGGVARDLASNANAAANAGDIGGLFAGANADIVADLRTISFGRGKCDGRQSEEAGDRRAWQLVAADATQHVHDRVHKNLRLTLSLKRRLWHKRGTIS
jgi:cytosine/adenosine deaminase-related metal-dependent hydrolase